MTRTPKIRREFGFGLAFAEEKQMERFAELSREGWHPEGLSWLGFGFRFRKGEPEERVYTVDYQFLTDERKDYYQMFADAGWLHVFSLGVLHVFYGKPDTTPIYTDQSTIQEKYERIIRFFRNVNCNSKCNTK